MDVDKATRDDSNHIAALEQAWADMEGKGVVDLADKLKHSERTLADMKQVCVRLDIYIIYGSEWLSVLFILCSSPSQ